MTRSELINRLANLNWEFVDSFYYQPAYFFVNLKNYRLELRQTALDIIDIELEKVAKLYTSSHVRHICSLTPELFDKVYKEAEFLIDNKYNGSIDYLIGILDVHFSEMESNNE